jgi:hypothetical protein
VVCLILVACGPFGPAAELCATPTREYGGTLVGSFDTTVGAVRSLQPRGGAPGLWPDLADDHPAVLCYIDAQIPKSGPESAEPYDRAVVAIVDGASQLVIAGYRDRLPVEAP